MIVKRTNLKNMYLILQGQENSLAVQHALQCWPFWIFCTEFEIWLLLYSKRMSSGSRVELLWQQTTSLSFQVKKCACIFQMVLIFHRIQTSLLRTKCHCPLSRNRTGRLSPIVLYRYRSFFYWVMYEAAGDPAAENSNKVLWSILYNIRHLDFRIVMCLFFAAD